MNLAGPFLLEHCDGGARAAELLALRAEALVGLNRDLREWDAIDALSLHLMAREGDGRLIGAARLSPDRRIGRLAVAADWRGQGVGRALLAALLDVARQRQWPAVTAASMPAARPLFAAAGFLPATSGAGAGEAGILHRRLDGPMAVEDLAGAIDSAAALIGPLRRELLIYSRALDPGLLDAAPVQASLRRFATLRHAHQVRCLLQEVSSPSLLEAPLLRLAQRLPTVFQARSVSDPIDAGYPSAYLVGDGTAYYFRARGNRHDDGEVWLEGAARARQLRAHFEQVWERSRPWSEHRALGI